MLPPTHCWFWGLVLAVHVAIDVSQACTKFSSSKSLQSSHSLPRSKLTVGIWRDEALLQKALCSDTVVRFFEQAELAVLIWFRRCLEFWLPRLISGFIHAEEPEHRWSWKKKGQTKHQMWTFREYVWNKTALNTTTPTKILETLNCFYQAS